MNEEGTRWKKRFNNFQKAFVLLEEAVQLNQIRDLSLLEEQGLIQRFEFTHELAWNVLKDYFEYQGNSNITGSRDAVREAFSTGLIKDGEAWMDMIKSRNQSTHTYIEVVAAEIINKIQSSYFEMFKDFKNKMSTLST